MALKKFPGFIDVHVHLRDPGATHKEDFTTGVKAAIKGGFTYILDMPNNPVPTITPQTLDNKITRTKNSMCDIGFHYGTTGENMDTFSHIWNNPHVFGLKIYCNHTTGNLLVEDDQTLDRIFAAWNCPKSILVHAEGERLSLCLELAQKYSRYLHVCHISTSDEVEMVRKAKQRKVFVTAGVTPHHLFLTHKDIERLENFSLVKPEIRPQDQDRLWEAVQDRTIDLVESDHAPHTKEEKMNTAFGVPGLETTLGLLFLAVHQHKLREEDIDRLLYTKPKNIFHIPDQKDTYIELDPDMPYKIGNDGYATKCGWSPFEGWEAYGKVETVVIKQKKVYG